MHEETLPAQVVVLGFLCKHGPLFEEQGLLLVVKQHSLDGLGAHTEALWEPEKVIRKESGYAFTSGVFTPQEGKKLDSLELGVKGLFSAKEERLDRSIKQLIKDILT